VPCLSFIPLPLSFSESFCPYPLKLVHDHVSTHRHVSGTGTSFEQRAAVERLEPLQYC
jgi:hypothetical protein